MATENNKKTKITGISILLITTGLFFVGRSILNNLRRRKQDEVTQNNLEEGSGNTGLTLQEEQQAKNYNPTSDVNYIYGRVAGWNFVYYPEINNKIASLTDAQVKKLADAYKKKNDNVSLYTALDDEWGNAYEYAMNRLSSLNKK